MVLFAKTKTKNIVYQMRLIFVRKIWVVSVGILKQDLTLTLLLVLYFNCVVTFFVWF